MAGRPTATRWPGARLKRRGLRARRAIFLRPPGPGHAALVVRHGGRAADSRRRGPLGAGALSAWARASAHRSTFTFGCGASAFGRPGGAHWTTLLRARRHPPRHPPPPHPPPHSPSPPRRRIARAQLAQFLRNPDLQTALDRQVETGLGHVLGQIALARSKAILLIVRVAIAPASP